MKLIFSYDIREFLMTIFRLEFSFTVSFGQTRLLVFALFYAIKIIMDFSRVTFEILLRARASLVQFVYSPVVNQTTECFPEEYVHKAAAVHRSDAFPILIKSHSFVLQSLHQSILYVSSSDITIGIRR